MWYFYGPGKLHTGGGGQDLFTSCGFGALWSLQGAWRDQPCRKGWRGWWGSTGTLMDSDLYHFECSFSSLIRGLYPVQITCSYAVTTRVKNSKILLSFTKLLLCYYGLLIWWLLKKIWRKEKKPAHFCFFNLVCIQCNWSMLSITKLELKTLKWVGMQYWFYELMKRSMF